MTTVITMLLAATTALTITADSTAQDSGYLSRTDVPKSYQSVTTSAAFINDLNTSAMRHFLKNFGEDANESWTANKEGTRARFTKDNALYLVDYDKKGNWSTTIRIYKEDMLPKDVRRIVKSVYYDYKIITVTELKAPKSMLYFVKLQDDKTLKTVQVVDGIMVEIEDFDRGDK